MAALIIFSVILQTVINLVMLSIGRQEPIETRINNIYIYTHSQSSHSFTDQKIQEFYRTFQDLHDKFSRTFFVAHKILNTMKEVSTVLRRAKRAEKNCELLYAVFK